MKRKLGIFSNCLCCLGVSELEALPKIKAAGFDCFDTGEYTMAGVAPLVERGKEIGLECESIHAPFMQGNEIWTHGTKHIQVMDEYKECIDTAANLGIPYVVIHLLTGLGAPQFSDVGFERMDAIVDYAVKRGVTIAFENLIRVGLVAIAADRYEKIPNVRFCYDFGHEHCYSGYAYSPDLQWLDIFTDRVVTTHVHDNDGFFDVLDRETDLHLLPFDGNIDYQKVIDKMDHYGYKGSLVLETWANRRPELSGEEFLALCYERLSRLANMSKMEL
jgi:sugar phosphate isomerase/epimerase